MPIDDPQVVHIELATHDDVPPERFAGAIEQLVRGHLGGLAALSERLVEGQVQLF